jgi:exodeoxyribonuclease-1
MEMIINHYCNFRYPVVPDLDPDAALYEIGFPSKNDEKLCWRFLRVDLNEQLQLTRQFQNRVYQELAQRLLFRNIEPVPLSLRSLFEKWMAKVNPASSRKAPIDYRGERRRTPAATRHEINRLKTKKGLTTIELSALESLENYLGRQFGH